MVENLDNIVLEQLRLIRETLAQMQADMKDMDHRLSSDIGELRTELNGQRGILVGLGSYKVSIDSRVEHLERKLGVDA